VHLQDKSSCSLKIKIDSGSEKNSFKSVLKIHDLLVHEAHEKKKKAQENYVGLRFKQSSNLEAEYLQNP
jgi:hypothetical protein